MKSWSGIPELKASYRQLGASRFWLMVLGTVAYVAIGAGLTISLDYPHAFGSACRHKCLIENYWYSPALLDRGGVAAYALFAWLWMLPTAVIIAFLYAALKKQRN